MAKRIDAAELDLNTMLELATFDRTYKPLPKFPASSRDIALVVEKDISVGENEKIINSVSSDILEKVKLFDVYEGEQVGENKKSVAYSLTYRAADRTLTDDEVSGMTDKILAALKDGVNAELR